MKKILRLLLAFNAMNAFAAGSKPILNGIENSRIAAVFGINQNSAVLPKTPSWPTKNININSFLNFDVNPKTMQKTMPGEEQDYFALSNLGVNFDLKVTDLISTHLGVAYYKTNKGQGDRYKNRGLMLDDAYLTIAHFPTSPLFAQGGLFYLPFGDNARRSLEPTLVQVLTITRAAGVQAGFANWHGLTGALYLAQGQLKDGRKKIQDAMNFGGTLNYQYHVANGFLFNVRADYVDNMLNVNALAESGAFSSWNQYVYRRGIPGLFGKLVVGYGPISFMGRYVTALLKSNDLIKFYQDRANLANPVYGAKPSAWDAGVAIHFNVWHKTSHIDFIYSRSSGCAGLVIFNTMPNYAMSRSRYLLGYTVNWNRKVFTVFQWGHNWLYKKSQGGSGRQGDNATIRLGIKL